MLRILIVEDTPEKLRRVLSALKQVEGVADIAFDSAHDGIEAKRLLKERKYDLLILDIAIPDRPENPPTPEGGIHLLEEIVQRNIYNQPREIVGLTAYPEVREKAARRFAEDLWLVIQYDSTSDSWIEPLQRKLRHIIVSSKVQKMPEYESELCIVVALPEPEMQAVLALPWGWENYELPTDGTVYHRGTYVKDGTTKSVYAASAPRMGMIAAAVLATKMINNFHPRYICTVGIAAGIRGHCECGDVVVADPGWDYGSGKRERKDGYAHFAPAPHQISLDSFVRGKLSLFAQDGARLDEIRRSWTGPKPRTSLSLHIAPFASGAMVLQDSSVTEKIKLQHRKVLAIDMEGYGVLAAAEEACLPQPKGLCIKSVCDFADEQKSDDFQVYAAYTSANALRYLMEQYL